MRISEVSIKTLHDKDEIKPGYMRSRFDLTFPRIPMADKMDVVVGVRIQLSREREILLFSERPSYDNFPFHDFSR